MKDKDFLLVQQGRLAKLGLSDTPPLISAATDTYGEPHRRNCLAWHLLCTRTRSEIGQWLKKQSGGMAEDMRSRLNQLKHQVQEMRREAEE
ncbi:hypothetical protein MO867_16880 [Microbulbifer sp. OS29]|uniref:Uncharacterized protein n=1 Tax=Microbulbifer okhotskensis TaxID=2926617 RepID=A0A9X2EPE4_9GAMM|nr:hypothetical protein [Microbulbifer okhotskensis]MCO1336007.1 hypothetical protein [Microbulbifer okhotskensis]